MEEEESSNVLKKEENELKREYLSQNQSLMETSSELGGILVAILTFLMALSGSSNESVLYNWECQIVLFLITFAIISFFTATTFYLRGTKPTRGINKVEYENDKGDIFYCTGWLTLLIIPIVLFAVLELYWAMLLSGVGLAIAWFHLFYDKQDKVGLDAIKLFVLGLFTTLDAKEARSRVKKAEKNGLIG